MRLSEKLKYSTPLCFAIKVNRYTLSHKEFIDINTFLQELLYFFDF